MNTLKKEFDDAIAGIAWSLWNELGCNGINRYHTNCLVPLEELIILTMMVSGYDPRLRDEALDWCSRYHDLISISRLRTLLKGAHPEVLKAFSEFAAKLNQVSSAKWPLSGLAPTAPVKVSGKSKLGALTAPSLFTLRLRRLFGPGARADIITYLITKNDVHATCADLVEIGYTKKSLMTALDNLASAGILKTTVVRNTKTYAINQQKELEVIIGALPKVAPPWNRILQMVMTVQAILPELEKRSDTTRSVIFRNCLSKLEPLLPMFIAPILSKPPIFEENWKEIIDVLNAFQKGNFLNHFAVYNEFDRIVVNLLFCLHQLIDSIDGIEYIFENATSEHHKRVFRECYQLFLSFVADVKERLEQFLELPFHKALDEELADIPYRFSKEELGKFIHETKEILPIDQVESPLAALGQYQRYEKSLDRIHKLIRTFETRLKKLHFLNTDMHLLTTPAACNKRHLVCDLFPAL